MEILIGVAIAVLGALIIGAFRWCFNANTSLSKIDRVNEKLDVHSDALAKMLAHQEMAKAYYEKIDDVADEVVELKVKVAKLEEK